MLQEQRLLDLEQMEILLHLTIVADNQAQAVLLAVAVAVLKLKVEPLTPT
jgi:hypothetical protein